MPNKKNAFLIGLFGFALLFSAKSFAINMTDDVGNKIAEASLKKPIVYASFFPIHYLLEAIAEDTIELHSLMPLNKEIHHWEPTIRDIRNLEKATLFFINGAGLEPWIGKIAENLPTLPIIELAQSVSLLSSEGEEVIRTELSSPNTLTYDPHIWLSVQNSMQFLEVIVEVLVDINPSAKELYDKNYTLLIAELSKLDSEYQQKFKALPTKTFIVTHPAFQYLAKDYNLNQYGLSSVNNEHSLSPKVLKDAIQFAKQYQISTIFYAKGESDKEAKIMADELQGVALPLETLEYIITHESNSSESFNPYLEALKDNLAKLYDALSSQSPHP